MQTNIYGRGTSSFFQTYRWHSNSNKIPFWLWSNTKHLYFRCFFGLRFWVGIYLWVTPQNGELTNAKTTLSALNSKKHIVSTRDTTVNLSKSLIRGAYVDIKTTFTSVDGIIPIPVLKATGWFCGGVEIQNITATSMTVRFLNSNQTTQDGGYANYILLFIK